MKELVKVNIVRQEEGIVEEDLLELIFADDNEFSNVYVTIGEILLLRKIKRQRSNWIELKKSIEHKLKLAEEDDIGDEELKGYLIQRRNTFKEILNEIQEMESKDEN